MRALGCESWCPFDAPELREVPPPPFIPGTAVAGTVLEGPLPPGTRVFAVCDWGALAEEAVVDAMHVMPLPDGPSFEAAIAFPNSYRTAAGALLWRAQVQRGAWVLVLGAGGGVGLAAFEIARALGARVIARAGAGKHAALRARGAELLLDSAAPFRDAVRAATGGAGVAWALDPLGGAAFDEALRCLAEGGTLLTVGFAAGAIPQVAANILLLKNIGVAGFNSGSYVGWSPGDGREAHAPRARSLWERLLAWWAEGALRPEVHARFPLERFREAMAEVRERRALGRVVITPSG